MVRDASTSGRRARPAALCFAVPQKKKPPSPGRPGLGMVFTLKKERDLAAAGEIFARGGCTLCMPCLCAGPQQ
jgi:hypothetical protein